MVAILEKSEQNTDFHPIVDFIEASPLRIETTKEGTQILATVDGVLRTVTESSLRRNRKLQDEEGISSLPDTKLFENLTLMGYNISPNQKFTFQKGKDCALNCKNQQKPDNIYTRSEATKKSQIRKQYTRRGRIAQSSALPPVADEPTSPVRDVSEGEAYPTDSGFIADQDRETIANMQQTINELTALCTSLQRQHSELLVQFQAQKVEINKLNARVKILEDNQGVIGARSADDASIKGRRIDEEEGITGRVSTDTEEIRMDEGEVAVERTSEDTEEMATVLTSLNAATVLAGGIDAPTGSYSIPTAGPPVVDIHTNSDVVPTASPIVATATVMMESDTPKKQRLQEQFDAQVARELEEQQEMEDKIMTEQIARDAEVARIHDNYSKIYTFQSQQRRPWTKKQKKDYCMTVIRNNLGWKVKDFKGMTFEEIEAKFAAVWKLVEDFIPMGSKEEAKMLKRKGFNLEQEKAKKQKTSEEVPDKKKSPKEIPEEKVKEMMQLVPIEEVYVQALQVKHPIINWKVHIEGQRSYWKIIRLGSSSACYQFFVDLLKHLDREDLNKLWVLVKEYLSIRPASSDKEMELWVELKRVYEPDPEDQLWAQTQNYMHAPIE
nr:hypothetical protein [Tanacetum cinerariifolium]